jgi:hypothetical protein
MSKYLAFLVVGSLALSGCALEDTDGDGIPDVYDTKDDRPGAGELEGVDYNGNQFVTPTPSPVPGASPGASPAASPVPAPRIVQSPESVTIPFNTSTTLEVLAEGVNLTYQWYEGIRGSVVTPVGTNSNSFTTPTLTTNKSYWVLVGNGQNDFEASDAAIVTVSPPAP